MADKTVAVRLTVRAGEFVRGMGQAGAAAQGFAVQAEQGAAKAASATRSLGIASAVTGKAILLGVGGAMVVSAAAAIEFESSLAGVAKTTDLAGPALTAFGNAIRNLALTDVPLNVNDLNRIAELGGQLGIQVPNLVDFTETIAKLGVTTNLSTEDAAVGLARLANILGTPQSEIENLGSSIVELGNNFATTEAEILTFALRLAPVGATVGLTEGAILGLATAMSSLGVPAERGGTALQRVFIDMKDAVDGGVDSVAHFADIAGVTNEAFIELFDLDPGQAFLKFVEGLDKITKSGGNVFQALKRVDIQEQRTIQALLAAANGHELLADALQRGADGYSENIALNEEAAKRFGTTASQIEFLKNAFNDLRLEIGNLILGSGGLTAGIDFLKEFFGVIKDNIPTLQLMARILVGLAIAKLVQGLGTMAVNAKNAFLSISQSVRGLNNLTTAARAASIATNLLNVAMNIAVGVGGIILSLWAMQAAEAAELRGRIRALNDEIERGVDPVQAYVDALKSEGIVDDQGLQVLNALGISVEELAEEMLRGADAGTAMRNIFADHNDLDDSRDSWILMAQAIDEAGANSTSFFNLITEDGYATLQDLGKQLDEGETLADAFLSSKKNELYQGLIEANVAAGMTNDQIDALISKAISLQGLSVTPEFVVSMFTNSEVERWTSRFVTNVGTAGDQLDRTADSWQASVSRMEDGDKILEKVFDATSDAASDWSDTMDDEFGSVHDNIRAGIPGWEEYSTEAVLSISKVKKSFLAFVGDMESWGEIQETIIQHASANTIGWLDSLAPQVKGFLGELPEDELIAFVDFMDEQFGRLDAVTAETWQTRLPDTVARNIPELIGAVESATSDLGLTAEQQAQAFNDTFADVLGMIPPEQASLIQSQVDSSLDVVDWVGIGRSKGQDVADGFLQGIMGIASQAARVAAETKNSVVDRLSNEWRGRSPSQVMFEFGRDVVAKGFELGMSSGFRNMNVDFASPASFIPATVGGGSTTVSNNSARSNTFNFNINADSDLGKEVRKGAVYMSRIVSLVESGAGR